jgi:hypothetical protein
VPGATLYLCPGLRDCAGRISGLPQALSIIHAPSRCTAREDPPTIRRIGPGDDQSPATPEGC